MKYISTIKLISHLYIFCFMHLALYTIPPIKLLQRILPCCFQDSQDSPTIPHYEQPFQMLPTTFETPNNVQALPKSKSSFDEEEMKLVAPPPSKENLRRRQSNCTPLTNEELNLSDSNSDSFVMVPREKAD